MRHFSNKCSVFELFLYRKKIFTIFFPLCKSKIIPYPSHFSFRFLQYTFRCNSVGVVPYVYFWESDFLLGWLNRNTTHLIKRKWMQINKKMFHFMQKRKEFSYFIGLFRIKKAADIFRHSTEKTFEHRILSHFFYKNTLF